MKPDKSKSGAPANPAERTFVRRVLIVIALVALAFLLWQLRSVLLMLLILVMVLFYVRRAGTEELL